VWQVRFAVRKYCQTVFLLRFLCKWFISLAEKVVRVIAAGDYLTPQEEVSEKGKRAGTRHSK
jgi:hypothetical protein